MDGYNKPNVESAKAPELPKIKVIVEQVVLNLNGKRITLDSTDFKNVGIEDSWVIRRLGEDADMLKAALNKLLNKQYSKRTNW